MLKDIKYESHKIEDVIIDLADEIKNGWKLYGFRTPHVEYSFSCKPEITVEVTLTKGF